jgi:arabinose operon protein AraL
MRLALRLRNMGVEMNPSHIYTAAAAAADYVLEKFGGRAPGETGAPPRRARVYNLATEGVQDMLEELVEWVNTDGEPCDCVIVGTPSGVYATDERQRTALALVRRGAAIVGIAADRVYPSPRGIEFGAGALSWMLGYAGAADPTFTGKPQAIFFHTLCQRLGVEPQACLLIGDNLETDIFGAKGLGMRTILTLTGVTRRRDLLKAGEAYQPDRVVEDLTELLE